MTEGQILLLWGKTCREKDDPQNYAFRYHPLLFHLIDVGHCTLELWDEVLSKRVQERIAQVLGCERSEAHWCLAFLAGAHDVGKATPPFQFQSTPLDWLREKIRALGLSEPLQPRSEPHNFVSSKELTPFFRGKDSFWRAEPNSQKVLAHITGAHHGTFPNSENYVNWSENVLGDEAWRQVRLELLSVLKSALCPPDWAPPTVPDWPEDELGAVPLLAGLISVADWIGSSHYFAPAGHRDQTPSIAEYLQESREKAKQALREFGWAKTPTPLGARPDFAEFWGFVPNSLQRAVVAQTNAVQTPFFLLAEAPMGAGKTECALWAADAALVAGFNAGFYVALPTQATSNAMHRRVKDYVARRFSHENAIHLQLVHGNAALSEDVEVVFRGLEEIYEEGAEKDVARVVALSWFCGAKRPLLAPFGVGTIDQSLLAALQTRHWFVRLFGLAGKVVVFDEVHAYDTYMSHLLTTLIGWLKELGCSVILLSATLPSSKRCELVKAWGAELPAAEAAYPRLTWCSDNEKIALSRPLDGTELKPKTVAITRLQASQLSAKLREKLDAGGCAAIVCNTVVEAQNLFLQLRDELGDFISPSNWTLFHARMPFGWRQACEDKILDQFGKKKALRPQRAIVIATQVIEQSLDLDFDWMASFMAPSDLLLQRLGRLHRHEKDEFGAAIKRPPGLEAPEFAIISDSIGDGPPIFGLSEKIYEREILLRSWLLWRQKTALELPCEIEPLIQDTYENAPETPNDVWETAIRDAKTGADNRRGKSQQTAENVVVSTLNANGNLCDPTQLVEAPSLDLRDEEDPQVHKSLRAATREGDPSITVICLCRQGNKLFLPGADGRANLKAPVDLTREPKRDETRALMNFALPLSNRALFSILAAQKVLEPWKKSPMLRHIRTLEFENGQCRVGDRRLLLDGTLGLIIEKEREETNEAGDE